MSGARRGRRSARHIAARSAYLCTTVLCEECSLLPRFAPTLTMDRPRCVTSCVRREPARPLRRRDEPRHRPALICAAARCAASSCTPIRAACTPRARSARPASGFPSPVDGQAQARAGQHGRRALALPMADDLFQIFSFVTNLAYRITRSGGMADAACSGDGVVVPHNRLDGASSRLDPAGQGRRSHDQANRANVSWHCSSCRDAPPSGYAPAGRLIRILLTGAAP